MNPAYQAGTEFEDKFAKAINDKKVDELNPNLKHFIAFIFPNLDKNEKIKCVKTDNICKPDVCIYQKNDYHFASLKSGLCEHLHMENIFSFLEFLREQKIDERIIHNYLLYHYGDGTTDGSGQKRISSVEIRFKFSEEIKQINNAFNSSKEFIKAFADRVMWQGVDKNADRAEILYHGDIDYGFFITRSEFRRHIDKKSWEYMERCIHIGPFVIRPKARYVNCEVKKEESRKIVAVSYPRLIFDMEYIYKIYNN